MSEMNFYRSKAARKRLRSFAKHASKNKRRTGLFILAFVLVFYLLFDNKGIIARVRLESERADMQDKIAAAQAQTEELKKQVKALETDQKTIETIARERYGMTRKGEKMYRVQKRTPAE